MKLFVYGTLKRGQSRFPHLAGQTFLGEARTAAKYRMYNVGQYPGLVEAADGLSIEGELWEIDVECLRQLDVVEGTEAGQYQRRNVELLPPFHDKDVITYFYARSVIDLPDCGAQW